MKPTYDELVTALKDTLQALEAHLDAVCIDRNILCPCSQNEVARARAILQRIEKEA
jgi:hypothetical protein